MGDFEEYFATEAEARAFAQGVEYFDDEHTTVEPPEPTANDDWVVRIRRFA